MKKIHLTTVKKQAPKLENILKDDTDYRIVADCLNTERKELTIQEIAELCGINSYRVRHCCYWLAQLKLISKLKEGNTVFYRPLKKLEQKLNKFAA